MSSSALVLRKLPEDLWIRTGVHQLQNPRGVDFSYGLHAVQLSPEELPYRLRTPKGEAISSGVSHRTVLIAEAVNKNVERFFVVVPGQTARRPRLAPRLGPQLLASSNRKESARLQAL